MGQLCLICHLVHQVNIAQPSILLQQLFKFVTHPENFQHSETKTCYKSWKNPVHQLNYPGCPMVSIQLQKLLQFITHPEKSQHSENRTYHKSC